MMNVKAATAIATMLMLATASAAFAQGAKQYAPGQQDRKAGETGKDYAPGQKKPDGSSAKEYAPGQRMNDDKSKKR